MVGGFDSFVFSGIPEKMLLNLSLKQIQDGLVKSPPDPRFKGPTGPTRHGKRAPKRLGQGFLGPG